MRKAGVQRFFVELRDKVGMGLGPQSSTISLEISLTLAVHKSLFSLDPSLSFALLPQVSIISRTRLQILFFTSWLHDVFTPYPISSHNTSHVLMIFSDFVDVKGSDFRIMCGGRAFEVHEIVLEEYEYFATMLKKPWKVGFIEHKLVKCSLTNCRRQSPRSTSATKVQSSLEQC